MLSAAAACQRRPARSFSRPIAPRPGIGSAAGQRELAAGAARRRPASWVYIRKWSTANCADEVAQAVERLVQRGVGDDRVRPSRAGGTGTPPRRSIGGRRTASSSSSHCGDARADTCTNTTCETGRKVPVPASRMVNGAHRGGGLGRGASRPAPADRPSKSVGGSRVTCGGILSASGSPIRRRHPTSTEACGSGICTATPMRTVLGHRRSAYDEAAGSRPCA